MRDRDCKGGYINEPDLVKELYRIVDKIDVNEFALKDQIYKEIRRFNLFQRNLLGQISNVSVTDIDMKNYIKFILREGEIEEKRNIIRSFNFTITINMKKVLISEDCIN